MIKAKTTFILGAGATVDLGMPLGPDLKTHIIEALKPAYKSYGLFENETINRALQGYYQSLPVGGSTNGFEERVKSAADALRVGLPHAESIDNFLHMRQGDELIRLLGKWAITACILKAEADAAVSRKMLSGQIPLKDPRLGAAWFQALFRAITTERELKDVDDTFENVAFIVFNYDRCLEVFLDLALRELFGITQAHCYEILKNVEIIHPYGQVGWLPWQQGPFTPLGGGDAPSLVQIASNIQTFTEAVQSETKANLGALIAESHTLVFTGFGYLEQNLALLRSAGACQVERVFATTKGISDVDVEVVSSMLGTMVGKGHVGPVGYRARGDYRLFIERETCSELMQNYKLRLTRWLQ